MFRRFGVMSAMSILMSVPAVAQQPALSAADTTKISADVKATVD